MTFRNKKFSSANSKDEFAREVANCAGFTANYLHRFGLGAPRLITSGSRPFGGENLASHAMITRLMGGTDHGDPDGYWADRAGRFFGTCYTMNDFRDLVQFFYDCGLTPVSSSQQAMRLIRDSQKRDI